MIGTTRSHIESCVRLALSAAGVVVGGLVTSCGDIGEPGDPPPPIMTQAWVSNPVLAPAGSTSNSSLHGAAAEEVVYVSLPPRTLDHAERVTIRNRRTRAEANAPVVEGGFDPVPIGASVRDTLEVDVTTTVSGTVDPYVIVVPAERPPIIVRTDPPPRKRDVPLNATLLIVFSEPIDPATLTNASVQLLLDRTPVPGELGFADAAQLMVTFAPDEPLAGGTEYELRVTRGIQDLDGESLLDEVSVLFATESPPTITITPDTVALLVDQSVMLTATVRDGDGHELSAGEVVSWTTTDPSVVMVTAGDTTRFATVTGVNAGVADVIATVAGVSDAARVTVAATNSSIQIDAVTTGADLDPDGYFVELWRSGAQVRVDSVTTNGTVTFAGLPAGTYEVRVGYHTDEFGFSSPVHVSSLAVNCTLMGPHTLPVDLAEDEDLVLSITVECESAGRIAFAHPGEGFGIATIIANGTDLTVLTSETWDADPAWSPDGTRIVFSRTDNGGIQQIYVMNADGSNVQQITSSSGVRNPAWSPDGMKIAFSTNGDIHVMNPDGSDVLRLTTDQRFEWQPTWSPDGTRIAFVRHVDFDQGTLSPTEIYVMDADGSNVNILADQAALEGFGFPATIAYEPAWSPDGTKIAFWTDDELCTGCHPRLFVMNPDGSALTSPGYGWAATWSPDGRWLLHAGGFGLSALELSGMRFEQGIVWVGPYSFSRVSWRP